eukprot:UN09112
MSATVAEAFAKIADKNSDALWLISEYDRKTRKLALVAEGSSNYDEFLNHFDDAKLYFCIFKVYGVDVKDCVTSKRDKLVFIQWTGPNVSPMSRNAVLESKNERDATFTGIAIEVQADDKKFLTAQAVADKLLAVGGAHKPTEYAFGPSQSVPVDFYKGVNA